MKITKLAPPVLPESLELKELIRKLNEFHKTLPPLPYELSKGSDLTGQNRQPTASQILHTGYGLVVPGYLEIAVDRYFEIEVDALLEITA